MDEFFKPIRTILPDGLRVITMRTPAQGIVAGLISIGWGAMHAAAIDEKWRGLPHFMEHVVLFGAAKGYKRGQLHKIIQNKFYTSTNASTSPFETMYLCSGGGNGLSFLTRHFWSVFELAAHSVFYPSFDQRTISHERKRVIDEITVAESLEERQGYEWRRAMHRQEWGTFSVRGRERDVRGYKQEDLLRFHQAYYTQQNTCVAISGDIHHAEAVDRVRAILGDVKPTGNPLPPLVPPTIHRGEIRQIRPNKKEETISLSLYFNGHNTASPKFSSQLYLVMGLSEILSEKIQKKFGLYSAQFGQVDILYPSTLTRFSVSMGKADLAGDVMKYAVELMGDRGTARALCARMKKLKEINDINNQRFQPQLETLTGALVARDSIGDPLESLREKTARFYALTKEDILGSLRELNESPCFLRVTGHPGCIDKAPSIDEIDAWRGWTGPSAPEKTPQKQAQAKGLEPGPQG